jgi:hypothetical protein
MIKRIIPFILLFLNIGPAMSLGEMAAAADFIPPTVTDFTLPSTSKSLTVIITSFAAKDNVAVTGYLVTETSRKPLATASGWKSTPQTSYPFTTAGSKTLYAWAKDAARNVSWPKSANVLIDITPPTVNDFTVPATSYSLTVPITTFTATDNTAVTAYLVNDSSTVPPLKDPGWSSTPPTSYKSSTWGDKILYAWARDAAGNVSNPTSASVNIVDKTPPKVTAFTIPATSTGMTVPITTFTATDNVKVTGYLVTANSFKPSSTAAGWSATRQTAYTFITKSMGSRTLYAWAKDAAGNVSASKSATVFISAVRLPRTGQTSTYGTRDDGALRMGVAWPVPRFKDNLNGTVTDNLTGLVWLKNANCFGEKNWNDALTAANNLASGSCGMTDGSKAWDWRLPNRKELMSLVDRSKYNPPLPPLNLFSNVEAFYWSSSSCSGNTNNAWGMSMVLGGSAHSYGKGQSSCVWPVRDGSSTGRIKLPRTGQTASYGPRDDGALKMGVAWPVPRFKDNLNGTVSDNLTGLVWLKDSNCFGIKKWRNDALASANGLASGACHLKDGSKAGDWRLPNISELESLVDLQNHDPAIPSVHPPPFVNVQTGGYWSSSSRSSGDFYAWYVYMGDGDLRGDYNYGGYVWPVRGGK